MTITTAAWLGLGAVLLLVPGIGGEETSFKEKIIALEKDKWAVWKQREVEKFAAYFAPDYVEVDASGRGPVELPQVLEELRTTSFRRFDYKLTGFRVLQLTPESAVVVYRFSASYQLGENDPPGELTADACSAWARRQGQWKSVYFQATAAARKASGEK